MIGGGHQLQQERFLVGKILVCQLQRLLVKVFISHTPGIFEMDLGFIDAALIDDPITIAAEDRIHVVKVATAPIHEHAVVTDMIELLPQAGETTFTAHPFDSGAPRCWRNRQGNGFQATVRPGARGIEVVEVQALKSDRRSTLVFALHKIHITLTFQ
ncbi:hypothetical protein D3C76_1183450 [compost metagenome]